MGSTLHLACKVLTVIYSMTQLDSWMTILVSRKWIGWWSQLRPTRVRTRPRAPHSTGKRSVRERRRTRAHTAAVRTEIGGDRQSCDAHCLPAGRMPRALPTLRARCLSKMQTD